MKEDVGNSGTRGLSREIRERRRLWAVNQNQASMKRPYGKRLVSKLITKYNFESSSNRISIHMAGE